MSNTNASKQALVVLLENGGIDLKSQMESLVADLKKYSTALSLVPDYIIRQVIDHLSKELKAKTDYLLESADLLLNRFSSAKPGQYAEVTVLRDGTATYVELKDKLIKLTGEGKTIDLFILTHGGNDSISVKDGINGAKIRAIKTANGNAPVRLRAVYMMNCVGSSLNQPWLDIGAKTASGAKKNNYLPEPSMFIFWTNWKAGKTFQAAVTDAYERTIRIMEDALSAHPALKAMADVRNRDFVKDSEPVIKGQCSVTIDTAV